MSRFGGIMKATGLSSLYDVATSAVESLSGSSQGDGSQEAAPITLSGGLANELDGVYYPD